MEFQKERVFTSLNADELKQGDKVIVAYNLYGLKEQVKMFTESAIDVIEVIQDEDYFNRFKVKHGESFPLAYLMERAENCTNCGKHEDCGFVQNQSRFANLNRCEDWKPKTEPRAEKHYRPFKDTDELIKVWGEMFSKKTNGQKWHGCGLSMPHIWVREKGCDKSADLITCYGSKGITVRGKGMYFDTLFTMFEFLDGSPCGVEA